MKVIRYSKYSCNPYCNEIKYDVDADKAMIDKIIFVLVMLPIFCRKNSSTNTKVNAKINPPLP